MKSSSGEGQINHYGLVRLRVNGSGNLMLRLLSKDEVRENVLVPLVMIDPTNIEPVRLSNFTEQRAALEIKTVEADEIFSISKIVIFSKPTATSYPGS